VLTGGERPLGGRFEVAYTPGHASHHVSYRHDKIVFAGDTAGVRIGADSLTIPPTPPPDIDVEAWHHSLETIAGWRPERLAITHFGAAEDVEHQLAEVGARLDEWAQRARTQDLETFTAGVRGEVERAAGPELAATYRQAAPPEQLYAGLARYWRKRGDEN
jgi:glyoxylase-like metal-dependent hydrolase (beta-lactamase superfamily II)